MIDKFKKFQAQIVPSPLSLEIVKAQGSYIFEKNKKYLDFIAGVSVCNIGHSIKRLLMLLQNNLKNILMLWYMENLFKNQV